MSNDTRSDIRNRPEGALLRTYLRAAGVTPEAFSKPLIGVATAASQVFSERPEARELGNAVASGIEAAGGIAVRWDTVRSPEMVVWGHAESYNFAFRDQLADMIESWTRQQSLDGLVLVADAPETMVGMTMAAARLNIPAVVVPVASVRWEFSQESEPNGKKKDPGDPFLLLTETLFAKKKTGGETPDPFTKCLLAHDNHADNAVYLALEAAGMSLPGISTAAPKSVKLHELAYASGERILALVKGAIPTRRILTQNAFTNAIRLNAALGGSVDTAVHLMALAHEAGVHLSWDLFDRIARETPQMCMLGGVSDKEPHRLDDLDKAGGVWAVLHGFKASILPNPTVSGKGALELARSTPIKDTHVIQAHRPLRKQSGLGVLKGNLAPTGAAFLLNQVALELAQFRGPAAIFDQEIAAAEAVSRNDVKKGSIIVVRNQGPRGGPGLRKLRILPALLESRGLNKVFPVMTDGRLPDSPAGLFVSFVSPEGALRGPLGILRNGDLIEIDIQTRSLGVRLTETEMQIRYARWQPPEMGSARGFLGRYSRSVSEAHEGAVLK